MTDDLSLKEYITIVEGNIKETLADLKESTQGGNEAILKAINKHDTRIRNLENWRWLITGGFAVILFIIGFLIKFGGAK